MATTILMERFQPDVVINTGVAGGCNPSLNIGDLVVSTEVCHHDVDATVFGYKYGQVPQMPPTYVANDDLIRAAEKAASELPHIHMVKGVIGSGDSFMSDTDRVNAVKEKLPDLSALEMEGAAIAQVAYQYDVPFLVIRSLSDIAGKEAEISYEQFLKTAAKNSADFVLGILKHLH